MTNKGRYQTVQTESSIGSIQPFARYQVIDTHGSTLGERFVAASDTELKADLIAHALNFNYKPGSYGYKLMAMDGC
jgi:hypothetical protein